MLYQAVLAVNGVEYPINVEAQRSLLSALRNEIGLTGSKEGCDDSECGACMVLIDGRPVNSCSYLALQANGREITTVEGLSNGGELASAAARLPQRRWRAVRVLHARDADQRNGAATREPESHRGRGSTGAVGQPLPLHGLPEDRERGAVRGRRARGEQT